MALPSMPTAFPPASAPPSSPAAAATATVAAVQSSISPRACGWGRPAPGSEKQHQPRPSRLVFDFSEEYLSQFFHLPQRDAAKLIGVAVITVKRVCKRLGIKWPYRAEKLRRLREQRALRRLATVRRRHSSGRRRARLVPSPSDSMEELSEAARRFARLPVDCMAENENENECEDEDEGEDDQVDADDDELDADEVVDAESILRSLALADATSYPDVGPQ